MSPPTRLRFRRTIGLAVLVTGGLAVAVLVADALVAAILRRRLKLLDEGSEPGRYLLGNDIVLGAKTSPDQQKPSRSILRLEVARHVLLRRHVDV
jgi:hypothetical protein